jgi:DNA-binding CsgD family transcriptional regulator
VRRHELSRRERDILLWACRGKTYGEIAMIVGLSFGSVKTYLDHARYKLNAVNLPQACAIAVAEGVLLPDEILHGHFLPDPAP